MNLDRSLAPPHASVDGSAPVEQTGIVDAADVQERTVDAAASDRICLGPAAARVVAAAQCERPAILRGLESAHRSIAIGDRVLHLEDGLYSLR